MKENYICNRLVHATGMFHLQCWVTLQNFINLYCNNYLIGNLKSVFISMCKIM